MDLQLTNKRALVTGSTGGIGKAIASMLASEGATVVIHGRDEMRAKAAADAIRASGGQAEIAIGDLATDDGADAVAQAVLAHGPLDILVNNAGILPRASWEDTTAEQWAQVYNINVIGGVRMIQRLVPQMRERQWGRIIQIGGGLAVQPRALGANYSATLAARHNLAVSLARELAGTGVTSNTVSPGAILTDENRLMFGQLAAAHGWKGTEDEIEQQAASVMAPNDIGRFGRPEEIAAAVVYLASPWANYISGTIIRVDGGTIRSLA